MATLVGHDAERRVRAGAQPSRPSVQAGARRHARLGRPRRRRAGARRSAMAAVRLESPRTGPVQAGAPGPRRPLVHDAQAAHDDDRQRRPRAPRVRRLADQRHGRDPRRDLQADRRPPHHPRRAVPASLQPRRAAAAAQRRPRRHEPGRPAAAGRRRGRPLRRHALDAPAGEARHDRRVAGGRALRALLRRDGRASTSSTGGRWSVRNELRILARTLPAVLSGRGAA